MAVRRGLSILGALALLTGSAAAASPAAGATAGSISGTVTSAATQAPVDGVCVAASSITTNDVFTGTTGADGGYQLTGVPDGDYLVAFNECSSGAVDGYAGEFYDGTRDIVQAATVTVSGADTAGIDATLDPAGILVGAVTDDASGTPLTDICVAALADSGSDFAITSTDANGDYRIGNLAPGSYFLAALDCGAPFTHQSEIYDNLSFINPQSAPTAVTTTANQTSTADFALAEGGELSGSVVASHLGRGVAGRCVQLISDDDPNVELDASTGTSVDGSRIGNGDYVIGGIPPGTYHAVFNGPGCGDDTFSTAAPSAPIVVTPGSTPTLDTTLTPEPGIGILCPADGSTTSDFPDVPASSTHSAAIDCLHAGNIVNGRDDGTFGPGEPVNRAQMAAFVARGLGAIGVVLPDNPPDAFDDDNGSFAELQINQLAALGVVSGRAPRTYDPGAPVSRGQMAKFIVGSYPSATGVDILPGGDHFTDDDGSPFEGFIDRLANAAITTGTDAGTYAPGAPVHRDQMASFIARALNRIVADDPFATLSSGAAAARAASTRGTPDPQQFLRSPRSWMPPAR